MKRIILVLLYCGFLVSIKAQQDPMFTHYMYNTLGINPAYAGSREVLSATVLHRSQWVQFPGAPLTQTITLHAPVFNDKFSFGASLVNDEIGPVKNTSFYVDYAYRIHLTEKSKLSFGLKFGFNLFQANLHQIDLDFAGSGGGSDPAFAENLEGQIAPNLGFGVYYSRDKFYLGVSTPRLFRSSFNSSSDSSLYREQQHYFIIAGSAFNLTNSIDFIPTTFVKITKAAPIEADFTGTFVYNNTFNLGAMYRTNDAFGLLTGINLSEQLYLGYSFDFSMVNSTAKYNKGSHELVLRYDFVFTGRGKIKSPRYF